jgi:hypothetical protein
VAVKAKLFERIPTYDYVGALKRMRKKRYGSTGSWLYSTKDFNAWITEDCSSLFCFTGIRQLFAYYPSLQSTINIATSWIGKVDCYVSREIKPCLQL